MPGYESVSLSGYFAPAKTPPAIIQRLNQEIARILGDAENKQRMAALGVELLSSTPEGFADMIKTETARMSGVFKRMRQDK